MKKIIPCILLAIAAVGITGCEKKAPAPAPEAPAAPTAPAAPEAPKN
jgi:hypothetical protein